MNKKTRIEIASVILPEALCLLAAKCSYIAIAWWLLNGKASPFQFALIIAISEFIETFSAPLLAPIVDRYGAAKVVKVSAAISLVVSLLLAASYGYASQSVLFVLLPASISLMALSSAIRNPAVQTYISQIINPNNITTCIAVRTSTSSLITVAGPAIGGVLTWLGGVRTVLILEAILYLIALILAVYLWRIPVMRTAANIQATKRSYHSDLFDGILAVGRVRTEFGIGILSAGINFVVSPFFSIVVPAYVVIGGTNLNAAHLGIIDSSFGIGIFAGAMFFMPAVTRFLGKFACLFIGYALLAVCLISFSSTSNPTWCALAVLVGGIAMPLINTHLSSLRLLATPQEYMGRMVGGIAGLCTIAIPFGTMASGAALEVTRPETVILLQGLLVLGLTPLLFFIPNLRYLLKQPDASLSNAYYKLYPNAFRTIE
ncbi:MAG: MFS transporter [Nitrosomonas sp.]|nr:MFS transporter [Nitrosomonas sp.]